MHISKLGHRAWIASLSMMLLGGCSCRRALPSAQVQKSERRVWDRVVSPSGEWIAVLDQVPYANGLLTSEEDRVCLIRKGSKDPDDEGVVVYSEDAAPKGQKATLQWKGNALIITTSKSAYALHTQDKFENVTIIVKRI